MKNKTLNVKNQMFNVDVFYQGEAIYSGTLEEMYLAFDLAKKLDRAAAVKWCRAQSPWRGFQHIFFPHAKQAFHETVAQIERGKVSTNDANSAYKLLCKQIRKRGKAIPDTTLTVNP